MVIVVEVNEVRGLTVVVRRRRAPDARRARDDVNGSKVPTTKVRVEGGTVTLRKITCVESSSEGDSYPAEDRVCASRYLSCSLGSSRCGSHPARVCVCEILRLGYELLSLFTQRRWQFCFGASFFAGMVCLQERAFVSHRVRLRSLVPTKLGRIYVINAF